MKKRWSGKTDRKRYVLQFRSLWSQNRTFISKQAAVYLEFENPFITVRRRSRRMFSTHFEIFRRRVRIFCHFFLSCFYFLLKVHVNFSSVFSERTTLRSLYAIGRPSVCCLSVVCDVRAPYSGGWTFRQFFSPYDSSGTLLFWCKKSLVGDAPFPLKFAFKVTHPL